MLNHIVLMGRLTRDPELRRTASGVAVATFSIAVDRDFSNSATGERETDFIDIVTWRSTAEFVSKYFTKGRMAVVSGRLQIRNWNDKEGNKRRNAEVIADNVYFGDSKREGGSDNVYGAYNNGAAYGNGPAYNGNPAPYGNAPAYGNPPAYGNAPAYNNGGAYAPVGNNYGYSAPAAPAPASDFSMIEDDDSQLPF